MLGKVENSLVEGVGLATSAEEYQHNSRLQAVHGLAVPDNVQAASRDAAAHVVELEQDVRDEREDGEEQTQPDEELPVPARTRRPLSVSGATRC